MPQSEVDTTVVNMLTSQQPSLISLISFTIRFFLCLVVVAIELISL